MSLGKVYEIVCNQTNERYIGSTVLRMCLRKALHKMKTNGCKSRQIIDRGDFEMNVLQDNVSKEILRKVEQEWMDKLECINDRSAFVEPEKRREAQRLYAEEWYKDPEHRAIKKAKYEENKEIVLAKAKAKYDANKEEVLSKRTAYYEANKDKIRAYQAEYRANKKAKSTFPKVEAKDN